MLVGQKSPIHIQELIRLDPIIPLTDTFSLVRGISMNARVLGTALLALACGSQGWASETCKQCPPSQYAPSHYWLPGWYRLKACHRGDTMNKVPCLIPAPIMATRYPCPTAEPAAIYEHSVFRLFEYRGPAPSSQPAAPKSMAY